MYDPTAAATGRRLRTSPVWTALALIALLPPLLCILAGIAARYLGMIELGVVMLAFPVAVRWRARSLRVVVHDDRLEVWAPGIDRKDPRSKRRSPEPVVIPLDRLRCFRWVQADPGSMRDGALRGAWDLRDGAGAFVRIRPSFIQRADRRALDELIRATAVEDVGPGERPADAATA